MVSGPVVDAAERRRRGRAVPKIIDHRNSSSRSGNSSGGGGSSSSPGGDGMSPHPPRNPVTSPDYARCKNIFSLSTTADKKKKKKDARYRECVCVLLRKRWLIESERFFFFFLDNRLYRLWCNMLPLDRQNIKAFLKDYFSTPIVLNTLIEKKVVYIPPFVRQHLCASKSKLHLFAL